MKDVTGLKAHSATDLGGQVSAAKTDRGALAQDKLAAMRSRGGYIGRVAAVTASPCRETDPWAVRLLFGVLMTTMFCVVGVTARHTVGVKSLKRSGGWRAEAAP